MKKQWIARPLVKPLLNLALLLASTGAWAVGNCALTVDEKSEGQQLLNAAVDQAKGTSEEIISQKVNAIKWWASKNIGDCPSEVTIQGNLEFAISQANAICSFEADVTKIAFRGGDGTLPRFIVNNKLKSCSQGLTVTDK